MKHILEVIHAIEIKVLILAVFFIGFETTISAKTNKIDSLRAELSKNIHDTTRINIYNELAWSLAGKNIPDSSLRYCNLSMTLCNKLLLGKPNKEYSEIIFSKKTRAINNFGIAYRKSGKIAEAIHYFNWYIKVWDSIQPGKLITAEKISKGKAAGYNNLGNAYGDIANYTEAIHYLLASLAEREKSGDPKAIAMGYQNLGLFYTNINEDKNALEWLLKAITIYESRGDTDELGKAYSNLGVLYKNMGAFEEAFKYTNKSLALREKSNDQRGIADCFTSLGLIYEGKKDLLNAEINYNKAFIIYDKISDTPRLMMIKFNLGEVFSKNGKIDQAIKFIGEANNLAKQTGNISEQQKSSVALSELYTKKMNYSMALYYYKDHIKLKDSIFNEDNNKKIIKSQMQFDFDKKEALAKAEQEKKDSLAKEEKEKQRLTLFFVLGGLVLVVVFSIFMFNRFRVTQRQKQIIESQKHEVDYAYEKLHEKNKEVMDSINYAKRIQSSQLPTEKYINKSLNRLMKN